MTLRRPRLGLIVTRMDVGGVPDHVVTLIGELKDEFEITLLTGSIDEHNSAALSEHGITAVVLPSFRRLPDPFRDIRLLRDLMREIRVRQFDVVHTHMSKAALAGTIAARLVRPRPRIVNTAHILGSIALTKPVPHWLFRQYDGLLLGRGTDAVIVVSEAIRSQALGLRIIPPDKLVAVQNGILPERFQVSREAAATVRAALGAEPDDVLVVNVARLVAFKGIEMLIDALALALPRQPRLRAAIVGDGVLRAELTERARARGIENRVMFTGVRRDVPEILAAADIFALPSICEGMPIAVLEAMAAGLPVLATAVDGIPEVVIDGEAGLLSPPRDAAAFAQRLEALAADPALRHRLGAAARHRVETTFSAGRMARNTAAIYHDLIRRSPQWAEHPGKAQA